MKVRTAYVAEKHRTASERPVVRVEVVVKGIEHTYSFAATESDVEALTLLREHSRMCWVPSDSSWREPSSEVIEVAKATARNHEKQQSKLAEHSV